MNIRKLAYEMAEAVEAFLQKARRFFYSVMLIGDRCPECSGSLVMVSEGRCRCVSCGKEFDPTVTFQRCSKCGGVPVLRVSRYQCRDCGSDIRSRFLFDGDYARLKDLVLGYDFPASWVSKIRVSGIQLYVRGTNLLTWVKDDQLMYDPEVFAFGYTELTTPPVKSVICGVNLNF